MENLIAFNSACIYIVIWTVNLKHWTADSLGSFIPGPPGYICILVIYSIFTWWVCDMPYNLYTKECPHHLPLSMHSEFLRTRVTSLLLGLNWNTVQIKQYLSFYWYCYLGLLHDWPRQPSLRIFNSLLYTTLWSLRKSAALIHLLLLCALKQSQFFTFSWQS